MGSSGLLSAQLGYAGNRQVQDATMFHSHPLILAVFQELTGF